MRMVMCSIRDAKAEAFSKPMFFQSTAQAIRAFGDVVNGSEPDNEYAKHPEDYTLFEVGSWNERTGEVIAAVQPNALVCGANLVAAV